MNLIFDQKRDELKRSSQHDGSIPNSTVVIDLEVLFPHWIDTWSEEYPATSGGYSCRLPWNIRSHLKIWERVEIKDRSLFPHQ